MRKNMVLEKLKSSTHHYKIFFSIGIFLLVSTLGSLCQARSILLQDGKETYSLTPSLSFWVDSENIAKPEAVINGEFDTEFTPTGNSAPNFAFSQKHVWLKFEVENPTDSVKPLLLQLNYNLINHIQLIYKKPNGEVESITTGLNYSYKTRPVDYFYYIFPLEFAPGQSTTFYMNVQSAFPYSVPLELGTTWAFSEARSEHAWILGGYFGLISVMILYNFFLFITIKDRSYLYYILFILFFVFFQISNFGLFLRYFPDATWWNLQQRGITGALATAFAVQFGRVFLNARKHLPILNKLMLATIALCFLCILASVLIGFQYATMALTIIVLIASAFQFPAGLVRVAQGYKPARYFSFSWTILILGSAIYQLWSFGLAPYNSVTIWSFLAGSSCEVVLLSLALGYRINVLKQEKMESAQLAAEARAEAEAKSSFLAKMSHEIRTPMNGILGMTELLRMTKLEPLQGHYASIIHNSGKSLLSVLNDILDHSKIEAGKLQLESIPFNLENLVSECISLFSVNAQDKKILLLANIQTGTPISLRGDPTRVRQILLNLIGNALKFTQEGEIRIAAKLISTEHDSRVHIFFSVKDTGIGIDENHQKELFEAFNQADTSITRQYGGTGLGLTICRQLVELMGGKIGVNSQLGVGSEFWFSIPFSLANPREIPAQESSLAATQIVPFKKKINILVAEDNSVNQMVIQGLLEQLDLTAVVASDGVMAWEKFRNRKKDFDIILMDCEMPKLDGYSVTKKIRQYETETGQVRTPIVALTAHALPEHRQRSFDAGMDDHLVKPIDLKSLREMLARWTLHSEFNKSKLNEEEIKKENL